MASRCPHCGSPLPLGSALCFDCGARVASNDHDPWEEGERTRIRPNTGEGSYQKSRQSQARHEESHLKHSVSREAKQGFERQRHGGGAAPTPKPQSAPPRQPQWQSGKKQTKKAANQKGASAVIPILMIVLYLMLKSCSY